MDIGHLPLVPSELFSAARRAAQTLAGKMQTQPQLYFIDCSPHMVMFR